MERKKEYIYFAGDRALELNYSAVPATDFSLTMMMERNEHSSDPSSSSYLFGSLGPNYVCFSANLGGDVNQITTIFIWNRYTYGHGGSIFRISTSESDLLQRQTLRVQPTKATIGNKSVSITSKDTTNNTNIRLMSNPDGTIIFNRFNVFVYGVVIKEGSVVVRNYIPAEYGGIDGLLDTVTGVFCPAV